MKTETVKTESTPVKKDKYVISTILLVLGFLLLATNSDGGSGRTTGFLIFFGSLAYISRKENNCKPSNWWLVSEIISVISVLLGVFSGIVSDNWYEKPITYIVIPLWITIAYIFAAKRGKINLIPKSKGMSNADMDTLERLAKLKKQGVITDKELKAKKKELLKL